jgi:phosphoadenosine phosphosulfate reductase
MTLSRPEEVIVEAVDRFGAERLALAASWQKETAVLVDLVRKHAPAARIFTLDTGVLFEQTYATWRAVEERYGIAVESWRGEWVHGLWATEPDRCCFLRKMEPLQRALEDADCWISGVRRDQSPDRARTEELDWDDRHGLWKANPLATWTERDVWAYIERHDLPYNPLHDQGYSSIGCTHCTLPGAGRDGRWAGLEKNECGMHAPVAAAPAA